MEERLEISVKKSFTLCLHITPALLPVMYCANKLTQLWMKMARNHCKEIFCVSPLTEFSFSAGSSRFSKHGASWLWWWATWKLTVSMDRRGAHCSPFLASFSFKQMSSLTRSFWVAVSQSLLLRFTWKDLLEWYIKGINFSVLNSRGLIFFH